MKQVTSFVISEFTNPSGEIVFRIAGWLDGERIRKNWPTRAEAEAERQVLEVQRLQRETGTRTTVTRLPEDQLHEAEAVFRRLVGRPRPLSFYVEFALANYREPVAQKRRPQCSHFRYFFFLVFRFHTARCAMVIIAPTNARRDPFRLPEGCQKIGF